MGRRKGNDEKVTEFFLTAPIADAERMLRIGRTIVTGRQGERPKKADRPSRPQAIEGSKPAEATG